MPEAVAGLPGAGLNRQQPGDQAQGSERQPMGQGAQPAGYAQIGNQDDTGHDEQDELGAYRQPVGMVKHHLPFCLYCNLDIATCRNSSATDASITSVNGLGWIPM